MYTNRVKYLSDKPVGTLYRVSLKKINHRICSERLRIVFIELHAFKHIGSSYFSHSCATVYGK